MFSSISSAVRTAYQQKPHVLRKPCRSSALSKKGVFWASCLLCGLALQDSATAFNSYNNYRNSYGGYDDDYYDDYDSDDDYYYGQGRSSRSSRSSYNSRRDQGSSRSGQRSRRSSSSSRSSFNDSSRYIEDMEDLLDRADRDIVTIINQIPDPYLQAQLRAEITAYMLNAQLITKRAQQSWTQHQEKMQVLDGLYNLQRRAGRTNAVAPQNGLTGLQSGLLNAQLGASVYPQQQMAAQYVQQPTAQYVQQIPQQTTVAYQQPVYQQPQQVAYQQPVVQQTPAAQIAGAVVNAVTSSTSSSGGRRH